MKDCLITIIIFFTTVTFNMYAQETEWQNMYPLNNGDYWVYETYGPGDYWASTDIRKVIGDSVENNTNLYKTVFVKDYLPCCIDEYLVNTRIDSNGLIYTKTAWDSTEQFYLALDVAVGDTFINPRDELGGYWEVGNIWYSNDNKKISIISIMV